MSKNSKLRDIVASQFPNFVQDDYPTFVAFLEAYYAYLDSQKLTRSLEYIKDIDKTLDEFIGYIRREIAPETPETNKFFLQNARKAQLARGSEESYRLLFRFLLKKEIEMHYPSEKMLRVSGGEWEQDVSFFLKVTSGDVYRLQNQYLYINSQQNQSKYGHRHRVYVKKIQKVETTADVYEVFIAKSFYGIINIGDTVDYNNVVGVIQPTTSKVKIIEPGSGFKTGQVFEISTSSASGMLVKVTKTTPEGALKQLQIIAFGVGFSRNFFYTISKFKALTSSQVVSGNNISRTEILTDGNDAGVINVNNYHGSDYVTGNYVGNVLADFYSANIPEESEQVVAKLSIELGAIAKYPGYYKSSNSLVDDDSYIQDGEYYQDFSYLIKLDEKLETYKDIVLSTIHPVGRKLFSEYRIESDFALNLEVSNPVIRIIIPQFSQTVEAVGTFDRVIKQVKNFSFIGDDTTTRWTLYTTDNPLETVILYVKINGVPLDRYDNWDIDGNDLVLNFAPYASDKIEVRYAVINYSGSATFQDTIFDFSKSLKDVTEEQTDNIQSKVFSKALSAQFGYETNAYLGGATQQTETDVRLNAFSKNLPTTEMLSSGALAIEKDTLTIGDTGTAEGALPATNLTIKFVEKPLASSSATPLSDAYVYSLTKPLSDTQLIQDTSQNKSFSKLLSPAQGYNSEAKMANGTGATESDSTDIATKWVYKPLADSIVSALFSESVTLSTFKPLASASENLLSDSSVNLFSKLIPTGISFIQPDESISSKHVAKPLSHGTSGTIDSSVYSFIKYLSIGTDGATEQITAKAISKALSDQIDSVNFTHVASISLSKPFSDFIESPFDSSIYSFGKNLSHSTDGSTDSISTKVFFKALTDITDGAAESITSRAIGKALTDQIDSVNFTHVTRISLSKPLSDFIESPTDAEYTLFSKALSHSTSGSTDSSSIQLNRGLTSSNGETTEQISSTDFSKALSDSIDSASFTHGVTRLFGKQLTDSIDTPIDSSAIVFNKYITDSVTVNDDSFDLVYRAGRLLTDEITIAESASVGIQRPATADSATTGDSINTFVVNKNLTEELILNNTGYLQLNPYSSDYSYFAEDFMSGRTTFTY